MPSTDRAMFVERWRSNQTKKNLKLKSKDKLQAFGSQEHPVTCFYTTKTVNNNA